MVGGSVVYCLAVSQSNSILVMDWRATHTHFHYPFHKGAMLIRCYTLYYIINIGCNLKHSEQEHSAVCLRVLMVNVCVKCSGRRLCVYVYA